MRLCGFDVGHDKPLFLIAGHRGLGGCAAPGAGSGARGSRRGQVKI